MTDNNDMVKLSNDVQYEISKLIKRADLPKKLENLLFKESCILMREIGADLKEYDLKELVPIVEIYISDIVKKPIIK